MKTTGKLIILGLVLSTLSGCVTTSGQPMTASQRAVGQCAFTVVGGALLGAALSSKSDRTTGALIGAAVGSAACSVLMEVAAKEDKARLAAEERAAIEANRSSTKTFKTQTGKQAKVRTKVTKASVPPAKKTVASTAKAEAPKFTACRKVSQNVEVGGSSAAMPEQLWCRVSTGDWQPVN